MRLVRRSLLFVLAVLFLVEAWIWDYFAAAGRWVAALVPFAAFKAAIARGVSWLPPYAALVLFAIPGLVVFPFKIGGLWLIARGHILAGGLVFMAAKVAGVGVAAFLFELTRDKLMTLGWFARLYARVLVWRDWAHSLIDPFKARIKAGMRILKARILRLSAGGGSGLSKTVMRLRERIRRGRLQG